MKLDPAKADFSKLIASLSKLQAMPVRGQFQPQTIKTLKAGKLEDWDLFELVAHDYRTELSGREDLRPVWERSRALLAVIAEMEVLGLRSDETEAIRRELASWRRD